MVISSSRRGGGWFGCRCPADVVGKSFDREGKPVSLGLSSIGMFTGGELHRRTTNPSWCSGKPCSGDFPGRPRLGGRGRKEPGKQPACSSYATEMLSKYSDATGGRRAPRQPCRGLPCLSPNSCRPRGVIGDASLSATSVLPRPVMSLSYPVFPGQSRYLGGFSGYPGVPPPALPPDRFLTNRRTPECSRRCRDLTITARVKRDGGKDDQGHGLEHHHLQVGKSRQDYVGKDDIIAGNEDDAEEQKQRQKFFNPHFCGDG